MVLMACDNSGTPPVIDCEICSWQETSICDDCVVTFLCQRPLNHAVMVDIDEYRTLRLPGHAGLVPRLRHSDNHPIG